MKSNYNLMELGWNDSLQDEFKNFKDEYMVGRIAVEYKGAEFMKRKLDKKAQSDHKNKVKAINKELKRRY